MQKKSAKKSSSKAEKPRVSAFQRKLRRQQIGMAMVGGILILAMVLALAMKF